MVERGLRSACLIEKIQTNYHEIKFSVHGLVCFGLGNFSHYDISWIETILQDLTHNISVRIHQ